VLLIAETMSFFLDFIRNLAVLMRGSADNRRKERDRGSDLAGLSEQKGVLLRAQTTETH